MKTVLSNSPLPLMRYAALSLVLCSTAVLAQPNLALLVSPPGDYIGGGGTYETSTPGDFSFSGTASGISAGAFGFGITMIPPAGESLTVGTYGNAARWPFNGGDPGIDVSGNGRGCNTICGSFEILELHFDDLGNIDRCWVLFTNGCECFMPPLTGEIRYNSQLATALIPPSITSQPPSQSVIIGNTATFSVGVSGTTPLTYQWRRDGTNLPYQTLNSLTLPNVQVSNNGLYSVVVSNAAGFTNSADARLTVVSSPSCVALPDGVVSWWAGEGSAADGSGSNNGILAGGVGFAPGKVGLAFCFTNGFSYAVIPDAPGLEFGASDFSIELWVQFASLGGSRAFVAKDEGPGQSNKWIFWLNGGKLQFQTGTSGPSGVTLGAGAFNPVLNHWYHVAVTRSGAMFSFYVDRVLISTDTSTAPIPAINAPLTIGQAENGNFMGGLEDEITIYNRALSGSEIQAIYNADSAGKCTPPAAPVVVVQPQDQTAYVGANVTLSVLAAGSRPLNYRWQLNGTNIPVGGNPTATNDTLVLANVQTTQGGSYSAVVSNSIGVTTSSNALLTVLPPGSCLPPPSGIVSSWGGEGNALDGTGPNNGTLAGGAGFAPGKVGLAFSFTNGLGYVQVPDSPSEAFGTNDFSIELWVQFASLGGSRVFIAKDEGGGQTHKWIFWLNGGQLQFLIGDGASQTSLGSGAFNPVLNQWYHVAVTRSGSLFTFYVNGAVSSAATSTAAIPAISAPLTFGEAEGQFFMGGLEDEITIYNRALSGSEIQAIYNADSAGKCSPPAPPVVVVQPQDQTAYAGANVTLNVLAVGSRPLSYQWRLNGTNIPAGANPTATTAALVLTNVQTPQGGAYSAVVSNTVSVATSSNALLTVLPSGSCLPPPSGIVSWWGAEANAADSSGPNNGTLAGGAGFAPGKVGLAFSFTNGFGYVQVPDSPSLAFGTNDFSIELWVQFASLGGGRVFIAKDEGSGQTHKWIFWLNGGQLQFFIDDGASQSSQGSGAFNPALNQWYQVAVTRSGTVFSFYVNGALISADMGTEAIPAISAPLTIGMAENGSFMGGLEDEITIYNRALSDNEIQAIYNAGSAGKCTPPAAPVIVTSPQSQTVFVGSDVTLSVLAGGSRPLSYQWQLNGTNIPLGANPTATTAALLLTNVQTSQGGAYSVVVSNTVSVAASSNALLSVLPPGFCLPPPSGLVSWWGGEGNALDGSGLSNGTLADGADFALGKVGLAFSFTNGLGYVQVPDHPSQAFGANDFSLELWVQFASLGGSRVFVAKDEGGGQTHKWIFWLNGGQLQLLIGDGASQTSLGSGAFNPALNQWYHVAVTRSGSLFTFYVNGAVISAATSTVAIPAISAPLTFGQAEGLFFMGGLEDEITIYNRALSGSEIQAIYSADSAGKCSPPAPPVVVVQPQDQTAYAGANVTLNVLAVGSRPLSYQWRLNGTNIPVGANPTATTAALVLTNVQTTQGGSYSVVVSNSISVAASSNALLTVLPPGSCLPPPSGLVSWWGGEGNALDESDLSNGTLAGGAGFALGKVGLAFSFTNGFGYVQVPDSPSQAFGANDFSIELWVQFASLGGSQVFIAKDEGGGQTHKWIFWLNGGQLQFFIGDGASQTSLGSGAFNPALNQWYHVAVTRSGSLFTFYVNGAVISAATSTVAIPAISAPLTFGQAEGLFFMGGLEDEITIYHRALSAWEIQIIYAADSAGKCSPPAPPVVVVQPEAQTAYAGANATLSVLAAGSRPLSYQWQLNGTNIPVGANPTATTAVLVLTNVQTTQGGSYSVVVSNSISVAASSNALLTVLPPGSCLPPPSGLVSWWGGEGNALDESDLSNGTLAGGAGFGLGKVGLAFSFTNGLGYVQVPDHPSQAFGANDFSIELWVQFVSLGGSGVFIAKDEGGGQTHKWVFWLNGGQLQFFIGDGASQTSLGSGAFNPALNQWYHVAVTRSGSLFTFYVNGAVISSAMSTAAIPAISAPLTFGQTEGLFFMGGLEDEITIYNRALSGSEIQAIYSADSAGKCRPPAPPVVVVQPEDQTAYAGANAALSVLAAGSPPLLYQWRLNAANIPGATNISLRFTNVQPADSGSYSVIVSNSLGSATSSNALLTVYTPVCAPPANGVAGWWAGEDNAADSSGTNHGVLINGAGFAAGMVGQAFDLNGVDQYVDIPNYAGPNPTSRLSLEAWVYPRSFSSDASPIIKKAGEDSAAADGFTLELAGANGVMFGIYLPGGTGWVLTPPAPVPLNQWTHVAGVFDGTNLFVYLNGSLVGTPTPALGQIVPSGNHLQIGHDPSVDSRYFNGLIDEATVYSTALSAAQVQSIYHAANVGKCPLPEAPSVAAQPQDLAAVLGSDASFSVLAAGSLPLHYQWRLNGANISPASNPTATNPTLVLAKVQATQAGIYSVIITNPLGSTTSSDALLTVLFPPTITLQPLSQSVQVGCSVAFVSSATGTSPLSYQWRQNGTNLPAQTETNLTILAVQSSDFGNYDLVAGNAYGVVTSSVAVLSLDHPPVSSGTIVQRYPGGGLRINVATLLANASDPDGDQLSVTAVSPSSIAGGTVSLAGPLITYLPPPGYTNADVFNYTLSDSHCGGTTMGTVLVLVRNDNNPASYASILRMPNGAIQVSFDGRPGYTYRVQRTDSLTAPDWQDVTTLTADQFGNYVFSDPAPTNAATLYYRSVSN